MPNIIETEWNNFVEEVGDFDPEEGEINKRLFYMGATVVINAISQCGDQEEAQRVFSQVAQELIDFSIDNRVVDDESSSSYN